MHCTSKKDHMSISFFKEIILQKKDDKNMRNTIQQYSKCFNWHDLEQAFEHIDLKKQKKFILFWVV